MIKKFFSAIGLTLILALFSFLLIMGGEEKPEKNASVFSSAKGLITSHDLSALAAHIGVSVPYLSAQGAGKVEDIPFADGYAQVLTWTDENNLTTRCAYPAAASALLRSSDATPTGEYCTIDGMTAMVFTAPNSTELHFGDTLAAYCLSLGSNPQTLIDLTTQLHFTQ